MPFFLLVIALSVLPWFTASDYPFGVFKLFLVVFVLYIVPNVSGVRFTRSLVLYVCFVDHCLSFCTFFFWPLCCLFFFVLQILITPWVSSNPSCRCLWILHFWLPLWFYVKFMPKKNPWKLSHKQEVTTGIHK